MKNCLKKSHLNFVVNEIFLCDFQTLCGHDKNNPDTREW